MYSLNQIRLVLFCTQRSVVSMAQQLLLLLLLLTVASVFSTIAAAPTPYWTDQWAVHIPAGKGRRNFIQQDGSL